MEIKQQILEANHAYRLGRPTMTDQDYDSLVEKLQKLVPADEFSKFRDSLNEGFINDESKVKHKHVAGSLNKLKYEEPNALKSFIKKNVHNELNVSAKVDGLSGVAHYANGKLVGLATRGDGYFGIDIFNKALFIKSLPKTISLADDIYIRGELVILKADFSKSLGTSPRNVVAGLVNRKDFSEDDIKCVSFIAYTIMGSNYTKNEQFHLLSSNGFKTAWNTTISYDELSNDDIADVLFNFATMVFEYDTDGLVISDSDYRNEDAYRPKCQVAFKTNLQTFETRLIDIDWGTPSKDGFLCPVAMLEPVDVNGVLISKCTLHNLDFITKKGLKIGSKVSILRSGDVIPKLISVIESDDNCVDIEYPNVCPCCGTLLVRDGINLRCTNKNCKDQVLYQLMHFIRKLDVKHCSSASLENFGILTFGDLLTFRPNPRLKMQTSLYSELLDKVFTKSKAELLAALNFRGLGETSIKKIVEHYGYERIEAQQFSVDYPAGIKDCMLQKFTESLADNLAIVSMIASDSRYRGNAAVKPKLERQTNGMSVCFTGKLNLISRAEASKLAEAAGYEVLGCVTKKLTYLVTNDTSSGSSKNRKAAELGTKIISELEFLAMVDKCKASNDVSDL